MQKQELPSRCQSIFSLAGPVFTLTFRHIVSLFLASLGRLFHHRLCVCACVVRARPTGRRTSTRIPSIFKSCWSKNFVKLVFRMPGGLCVFNSRWLESSDYSDWLQKDASCNRKAVCSVCKTTIDISRMGEGALRSHHKGAKHKQRLEASKKTMGISAFCVSTKENVTSSTVPVESTSGSTPPVASTSASNVAQAFSGTDVLKAEIVWTLKCIQGHYSYSSCSDIASVFRTMFPNCGTAAQFTCGEVKVAYLAAFGIGPYLQDQLRKKLSESSHVVLLFDETHNKHLQEKQLDLYVRFWDNDNLVRTTYMESCFLGHARATDIMQKLDPVIRRFNLRQILQLSMDGPNVNKKIHADLQKEIEDNTCGTRMLDVGTCGLHTLHNAFKSGKFPFI